MLIVEFTDNEERLYQQTVEWLSTKLSNAPTYLKKATIVLHSIHILVSVPQRMEMLFL